MGRKSFIFLYEKEKETRQTRKTAAEHNRVNNSFRTVVQLMKGYLGPQEVYGPETQKGRKAESAYSEPRKDERKN